MLMNDVDEQISKNQTSLSENNNSKLDEQSAEKQGITNKPEDLTINNPNTSTQIRLTEPSLPLNQPQQTNQVPSNSKQNKRANKSNHKRLFIICGIAVFVVILFSVIFMFFKSKDSLMGVKNNTDSSNINKTDTNSHKQLQSIVFNAEQQEVAYIPIFSDQEITKAYGDLASAKSKFKFYKIGTVNNNDSLILARISSFDPSGEGYALILKQDDAYTLLLTYSSLFDPTTKNYTGLDISSSIKKDETTIIPQLQAKDTITFNGVSTSLAPYPFPRFIDINNDTKQTEVAKIEQGTVYEQIYDNPHHPGVKQFSIVLKQPTGMYLVYRYTTDILKDDNSVTITYKDGKTSTEKYSWAMIRAGCGVVDSVNVVDKKYFNDLTEIGKVGDEPIYGFKSSNHQVMTTLYQSYNMDGSREGAVSQEQFWKDNGVVVVKNKLGYRVILVNDKFQAQGECGKPVIYLYPQQKTDLTVRVGANVTVSDPAYNTGWDVTANPNGQIYNKKDGKTYPYLFWEGQGHGLYPKITEGFVVKHSEIEQTLWSHLSQLGLNQQESKDFMEFWLPKMPNTPYVRLTWFGTEQMNKLAPLSLSVKPDTSIRVFLDFQGLDKPINLKPQKLTHKPRSGFTMIEWGGLLYK